MAKLILAPSTLHAAGTKPKVIEEFIGVLNSNTAGVSIARMRSPEGWSEPGQRPDFDEYTLVLRGAVTVRTEQETLEVLAGQAVIVQRGEWVQYSTPALGGAEYIAVCVPAFSPNTVHRDQTK